jgi:hypothetical protein
MTPSGIEPATFQLVAQFLKQLRHHITIIKGKRTFKKSRRHLNILGTRKVREDKFHTKNLHIITGATVQNLVAQAT